MTRLIESAGRAFRARVRVPGDKSLSHRFLFLAAMGTGTSQARGLAPGHDVVSTMNALRRLGNTVDVGRWAIVQGTQRWTTPKGPIDCGNSGTTMRLLAGAVAGRPCRVELVGDDSLMRRPMARLVAPLSALGASVETDDGTPPVRVTGASLHGSEIEIDVASAQVRTAVAFAALTAEGPTQLSSPPGFRDHTERWLMALGRGRWRSDTRFEITPGPIPPLKLVVPGDPSSAAFLWAAAAITPGSRVVTPGVSINPGRLGFLTVLRRMGAFVDVRQTGQVLGDPVGTVTVGHRSLTGTEVAGSLVASALDEAPLIAVVAAFAQGDTVVSDAVELRTKESDRISSTVEMIRNLGGVAEATDAGFIVTGSPLSEGRVDAHGDHRIAMAAAVAVSAGGRVEIDGFEASEVSWPGFVGTVDRLWSSP